MNYENQLTWYKSRKKSLKDTKRSIMLTRMVADNIKEFVLPEFEITLEYNDRIVIHPKGEGDAAVPMNTYAKQVDYFARKMRVEPYKSVDENSFDSNFYLYPNGYQSCVVVFIRTKNTEKCEITYKRKMQKIPVATGYCKELLEKKHVDV